MTVITFVLLFAAIAALSLICHWLDNKYQWRLHDWLNGTCHTPFSPERKKQHNTEYVEGLKQRIETLEAIVTEPGYELKRQINKL